MKPGQVLRRWWQVYVAGGLRSPRDLFRASQAEVAGAKPSDRFFAVPDDDLLIPSRLLAASFIRSNANLRQWDLADWQGADRRLMVWAGLFIEAARKRGIPLYVHCAFRGEAEQNALKAAGRSKAAYPSSAHNIAEAVDIVHGVFLWELTRQEWEFLHVLGLRVLDVLNARLPVGDRLSLTWGGGFRSLYDPAHWEVSDYRMRLRRVVAGPPVRLTPVRLASL